MAMKVTQRNSLDLGIDAVDLTAAADTEYASELLDVSRAYAFFAIVDIAETGAPTVGDARLLVRLYDKDKTTLRYEMILLTGIQSDVDGNQVAVTWGYGLSPFSTDVAGGAVLSVDAEILKLAAYMRLVLEVVTANDGTTSTGTVNLWLAEI
jgi:hypothetical protein